MSRPLLTKLWPWPKSQNSNLRESSFQIYSKSQNWRYVRVKDLTPMKSISKILNPSTKSWMAILRNFRREIKLWEFSKDAWFLIWNSMSTDFTRRAILRGLTNLVGLLQNQDSIWSSRFLRRRRLSLRMDTDRHLSTLLRWVPMSSTRRAMREWTSFSSTAFHMPGQVASSSIGAERGEHMNGFKKWLIMEINGVISSL